MECKLIKTVDELNNLNLQNCYARHLSSFDVNGLPNYKVVDFKDKVLVGKPVIAAFLGISVKTLKRYFNEVHKCHNIPVQREQYRCLALSNHLIFWQVTCEINKFDSRIVDKAQNIAHAEILGVSLKYYMTYYVYDDLPHLDRLRTKKYYKKTVDKIVNLTRFQMYLGMTSALTFRS